VRARILVVTIVVLAAVAAAAPARSREPFVPVTPTEKGQTRPLAEVVLAANTSGESWRLCALISAHWLRQLGITRARCFSDARRHPAPPCKACTYSRREVVGIYATAAARRQGRKTVVWTAVVKGDPRFKGPSEIEMRFIRESDRWRLDYMLTAGNTS